ncbi:transcriptional regulator [Catellatospora methionotrophica]|uniref:Transcriptional regulator n=1 Tax=Catellatospora methionotrophica TaxID=121620 RepID=A0A8J3L927_9ACTN|nr:metalloregulator ArsR/SmtB family transcription factor [Catellatospora methionotrophica]GIG13918.1 transcriptional regulator [Catellatospora methionotrophica]
MSSEGLLKITDPSVMRALAHPARIAIMDHLSATGEDATATECAEMVGLSPSATSYHLRALAKAGLIEDAPSRGDGRERVWRARTRGWSLEVGPDGGSEARAAESAVAGVFLAQGDERVRRWLSRSSQETTQWFDAALMSEFGIVITADELTALTDKMAELLEPYKVSQRQEVPADARRVTCQIRAVPVD